MQADAATISGDQGVSTFTNSKYICIYGAGDPASGGEQVGLSIVPGATQATADALQRAAKANATGEVTFQQVSGLGDLAYSFTSSHYGGVVFVKSGDLVLLFSVARRNPSSMAADAVTVATRIAGQI